MTPEEKEAQVYIQMVVDSPNPDIYSTHDEIFKKLSKGAQEIVIQCFDGYGLRDMLRSKKKP